MITPSIAVSNAGGTTPNFTAAITDLQAFLVDVYSHLQPATYAFVYDAETEEWTLNGYPHKMKGITLTVTDDTEDMLVDGDTVTVTIAAEVVNASDPQKRTPDMYDYMDSANGTTVMGLKARLVFVEEEADLTDLPDDYRAGAIAATIGFGKMWQMNGAGSWVAIGTAEGEGT